MSIKTAGLYLEFCSTNIVDFFATGFQNKDARGVGIFGNSLTIVRFLTPILLPNNLWLVFVWVMYERPVLHFHVFAKKYML